MIEPTHNKNDKNKDKTSNAITRKEFFKKSALSLLGLSSAATFLASCDNNFLDRRPTSSYSNSSLWSSATDARQALNSVYDGWENGFDVIYMDCASDNGYNQFPWEGYTALGNMQLLTPTNTGASRWDFTNIQRANWFLENVDKASMDSNLESQMKGQARFLRAYQYFIRAQLYGDFPLVTKTLTTEEANNVKRTSKDKVIKFVVSELGAAAPHLPASYSGSDAGRITKGAALALKARVELYQKDYDQAAKDAKTIMDSGVYQLFPSYANLFRIQNEHNSEVILDVEYNAQNNPFAGIGRLPSSGYGGWASIDPTQSLVDAYEMKNGKPINAPDSGFDPNHPYKDRDPRLSATIAFPGQKYNGTYFDSIDKNSPNYYNGGNNSKTGYLVRKFTAHLSDYGNDIFSTGLNMIVIRYAEVLLTYAEAKIELNQIDQSVYDAIDAIRNRAGMPSLDRSVHNSQETMRKAVRRERRVELAMEGLRWFDVQRWKIGDKVMNGEVYGARLGSVDSNNGKLTLSSDRIKVENRVFDPSKNYLWPVPQSAIDVNGNLKQNPGYS